MKNLIYLFSITLFSIQVSGQSKTTSSQTESNAAARQQAMQKAIDSVSINMVSVTGGKYMMGCTPDQGDKCTGDDAKSVTVGNFSVSRYTVTQLLWEAIMGNNPTLHKDCPSCPVTDVNWDEAQQFISKLNAKTGKNYRLPTEAEYEYAARGGNKSKGYKYAGSNDINAVAWYDGNGGITAHPVGQKQPNELGLYDLSGNVWQWCSDWRDSTHEYRIARGGSYANEGGLCRVSTRLRRTPDSQYGTLGFRIFQDQ